MAEVMLSFKKEVSEERRETLLAEVGNWPGVQSAAPLKRDVSVVAMRRFSFVRVNDANAAGVAEALRNIPEVEAAELAPQRGLAID